MGQQGLAPEGEASTTEREGRVLVVDDDDAIGAYATLALAQGGYDVRVARNGALGLEAVLTFRPEVVVFDFWMPVADGRELLQGLREVARTRIGLVAMSATPEVESWCERVGVNEFVRKPFSAEDLRAAVGRARDLARRGSVDRLSLTPGGPVSRRLRIARVALVVGRDDLVRAVRGALRAGDRPMQVAVVPEVGDAVRALGSFAVDVIALCGTPDDLGAVDVLALEALRRGLPLVQGATAEEVVAGIGEALAPAGAAVGS